MKALLRNEIISDRTLNGWMGILFGAGLLALGAALGFGGGLFAGPVLTMVFGALCLYSGLAILRGHAYGWLLACLLSLVFTSFVVFWNWDGASSLARGIIPLISANSFFLGYLEERTRYGRKQGESP